MSSIYLDHAATTPLDPGVLEVMLPYLREHFGNPSSVHARGRKARFAVEESRERVAAALGAEPGEIVFTSGGTEANNTALRAGLALGGEGAHLVTSAAEHEAVLRPAEYYREEGGPVTILTPEQDGAVTPAQLRSALREDTALVSLMHANNEIGTVTDVQAIADICRERDVLFHCDTVQTAGLFPLDVRELGVDMLSISGHKFYGPKGVGVLYVRGGVDLSPLLRGGSQERDRRAGTENVASIVGLAEALDLAVNHREERLAHLRALRSRLLQALEEAIDRPYRLNTPRDPSRAAPHIINISFPAEEEAIDGEMLLLNLDMEGVQASSGSACTSGALQPSHVLLALGLDRTAASNAVRFSMGKDNTLQEMEQAAQTLGRILRRMEGANQPSSRKPSVATGRT